LIQFHRNIGIKTGTMVHILKLLKKKKEEISTNFTSSQYSTGL